jgi:hypothetical protein
MIIQIPVSKQNPSIDYMISVMEAAKQGLDIQVMGRASGDWKDTQIPNWDWNAFNFRVKIYQ